MQVSVNFKDRDTIPGPCCEQQSRPGKDLFPEPKEVGDIRRFLGIVNHVVEDKFTSYCPGNKST